MYSNLQASLRESWLDDMMHVLEGEALGQDAATVEAAFKRHEAIGTDVKARVSVNILLLMNTFVHEHVAFTDVFLYCTQRAQCVQRSLSR